MPSSTIGKDGRRGIWTHDLIMRVQISLIQPWIAYGALKRLVSLSDVPKKKEKL